jgi:transcriptional regulator with XRE-family HTH domain
MTPVRLRVREWRDLRQMSQSELATKAGIRQATLSAIESGSTTRIDLVVLDRLATALGVDPAMLIGKD